MNSNAEEFLSWIGGPYMTAYRKNPDQALQEGVKKANKLCDAERRRMVGVLKNTCIRLGQVGLPWGGGKLPLWVLGAVLSGALLFAGGGLLGTIPLWAIAALAAWDYWQCTRNITATKRLVYAIE